MPYFLSPLITENDPGLWFEGDAYKKQNLYSIENPEHPPVNYDSHTIKPHSLAHMEAPAHIEKNGKTVDSYFDSSLSSCFYGKALVVKLKGEKWEPVKGSNHLYHWEVSKEDLIEGVKSAQGSAEAKMPDKIILTIDKTPLTSNKTHNPDYALTLSEAAASLLISNPDFNMYGTSWKSTDFCPGKNERPIHKLIFSKAIIFECLDMEKVPEGQYFFVGVPLPFKGASESPVCPILFNKGEISF